MPQSRRRSRRLHRRSRHSHRCSRHSLRSTSGPCPGSHTFHHNRQGPSGTTTHIHPIHCTSSRPCTRCRKTRSARCRCPCSHTPRHKLCFLEGTARHRRPRSRHPHSRQRGKTPQRDSPHKSFAHSPQTVVCASTTPERPVPRCASIRRPPLCDQPTAQSVRYSQSGPKTADRRLSTSRRIRAPSHPRGRPHPRARPTHPTAERRAGAGLPVHTRPGRCQRGLDVRPAC